MPQPTLSAATSPLCLQWVKRLAGLVAVAVSLPTRGLRRLAHAWRNTLAEEHLRELDPRLLRDIGLERREIREAVRRSRHREGNRPVGSP